MLELCVVSYMYMHYAINPTVTVYVLLEHECVYLSKKRNVTPDLFSGKIIHGNNQLELVTLPRTRHSAEIPCWWTDLGNSYCTREFCKIQYGCFYIIEHYAP